MSTRRGFLGTLAAAVVVVLLSAALATPPDPFSQVLALVPGLALAVVAAHLLAVEGGWRRLGLDPAPRDHVGFVLGFVAGAVLARSATGAVFETEAPVPWSALVTVAVAFALGGWLGYGGVYARWRSG